MKHRLAAPLLAIVGLVLSLGGTAYGVSLGGHVPADQASRADRGSARAEGDAGTVRVLLSGSYSASYQRLSPGAHGDRVKNQTKPVVKGTSRVGSPLKVTAGTWKPGSVRIGYQWLADGRAIKGADRATYTPTPNDLRSVLTVAVKATKSGYRSATVVTPPTARVKPGELQLRGLPTVSGKAVVGKRLDATPGRWSARQIVAAFQWLRDGHKIKGADEASYKPTAADVGDRLSVVASVSAKGYRDAEATSAKTVKVARR